MTGLVASVPRPEGQAALDKVMDMVKARHERLVAVNASLGGAKEDPSMATAQDVVGMETLRGTIYAEGGSKTVWTDFKAQKSAPLPDWLRQLVS
jgi:acyl-CoA thioesterase FadM